MSDEDEKKLEALNQSFNERVAFWGTIFFALVGIWFYCYYALAYIGLTYIPYILIYGIGVFALYLALRKFKVIRVIGLIGLLGVCILVSMIKMNWKHSYYESEAPMLMSAHIEKVISWEAHLLSPIVGIPDWFRFNDECVQPVLNGTDYREDCKTTTGIYQRYNIDMEKELEDHLGRMRHTAGLIEKRGSLTAPQYKSCIQKRECAEIPVLPQGVDSENIDPENATHVLVSKVFWDLVEAKPLNRETCSFIVLCNVLYKSGAVSFD